MGNLKFGVVNFYSAVFLVFGCLMFGSVSQAAFPNHKAVILDSLDDDLKAILLDLFDEQSRNRIEMMIGTTGNAHLKSAVVKKTVAGSGSMISVHVGTDSDLSAQPVTAFAGNYELEGQPLFTMQELLRLRELKTSGRTSVGAVRLHLSMKMFVAEGKRMDITLQAAATDLVAAIRLDRDLAKRALGDLFVMGIFKKTASGEIVGPYNTEADRQAAADLIEEFNNGIFENMYHVPSDTVQQRIGLPGGYIPETGEGGLLRTRLTKAMEAHPLLRAILATTRQYNMNWRDYVYRNKGIGLGEFDRWVPGSIQNPEAAAGFYISDILAVALSKKTTEQLAKLNFEKRSLVTPLEYTAGQVFIFTQVPNGTPGTREIHDLQSFDGVGMLNEFVTLLEGASKFQPLPSYYNSEAFLYGLPPVDQSVRLNIVNQMSNIDWGQAMVMVFKNSVDDWFALDDLIATDKGLEALRRGGIICEGFNTQAMAQAVLGSLAEKGITDILVAAGYQYKPGEVDAIPNFKGEIALNLQGQAQRAFADLLTDQPIQATAQTVIVKANAWAQHSGRLTDAFILGEGIDLFNAFLEDETMESHFGSFYVMGGGRYDDVQKKFLLSRNGLPHTEIVIGGLERLAARGKKVYIFSSQEFGGTMSSVADESLGNGAVVFERLNQLSARYPALNRELQHWHNWTRIFKWVMGSAKQGMAFDANQVLTYVDASPLAVHMSGAYLMGALEENFADIQKSEISLSAKLAGQPSAIEPGQPHGVYWLTRDQAQGIRPLVERLSSALVTVANRIEQARHYRSIGKPSVFTHGVLETINLHETRGAPVYVCEDLLRAG